jgi:chlorite dismutase
MVRYRPTTPNYIPPSSAQYLTPTNRTEFDSITYEIQSTLTPKRRHQFTRLQHAYIKESTARICLQREESTARKETYTVEEQALYKRLRKTDDSMLWNLQDVMESRGHSSEEIEHLLQHQANREHIYIGQISQPESRNQVNSSR